MIVHEIMSPHTVVVVHSVKLFIDNFDATCAKEVNGLMEKFQTYFEATCDTVLQLLHTLTQLLHFCLDDARIN